MSQLPDESRPRRRWRGGGHIGPLLRDPTLTINELVSKGLAAEGFDDFRPAHGTIGQHIADEGSRITELAELAQMSKPAIVYLVNDLEQLGYVERVPDPADGRAKLVRMTERGVRAQRAGREIVVRIERDWAELIGREDFDAMIDLLGRLHEALWPEGRKSPR